MNLSPSNLTPLKTLLQTKTINEGKFKNKEFLEELVLNGAVEIIRKTPKRKVIHLLKEENIFNFLKNNKYAINSLEELNNYIEEMSKSNVSRATIQKNQGNTKRKKSPSLKGLYISAPYKVELQLDEERVTIIPQNGMGYFFFYTQKVILDRDTIIVGVENYQVVWFAQKYAQFFEKKTLFVMINPFMLKWLEDKENEYIHFGDYDLAGINIYQNKVVPRLQKSVQYSMFIPHNIEKLIKEKGDIALYEKQIRYKNMFIFDKDVKKLRDTVVKYKKSLEQEGVYEFT